jgi:hypothetical protein
MDSDEEANFFNDVLPPTPSMLILTWNIWFTGLPASHAARMQAIREFITKLHPDVIMLQVRLALVQPLLCVSAMRGVQKAHTASACKCAPLGG